MVERERKGHSATVEDFAPGLTSWLQRNRQYFMILLAAAAFAVLLSELLCMTSQPYSHYNITAPKRFHINSLFYRPPVRALGSILA